ncbi:hypothetical protein [Sphingomonas sp. GC_Shp_3]|uniref:hypothetical protein n=1 Tax=Sphingomonas sp. GC_Shp_3 TaxID=2937383 RepID=UPI00226AC685|nr:hypothetical protein [Sphingomonas sp. GC_Shp_3]
MALNIASLAVAAAAKIHLKGADGELLFDGGKPVCILVHSPGSKPFSTVESRQTARAVKRLNDNEGKVTAASADERRAETAEDLAAITIAFENLEYPPAGDAQGEQLFVAVYSDPGLGFITKQVTKFLADWGNFKPGSAGI